MSVDNFSSIYTIVKKLIQTFGYDACHGFILGCSQKLKHKMQVLELFDSITTDPHKVFNIPYVAECFIVEKSQSCWFNINPFGSYYKKKNFLWTDNSIYWKQAMDVS